jgi:hypothetical protein
LEQSQDVKGVLVHGSVCGARALADHDRLGYR